MKRDDVILVRGGGDPAGVSFDEDAVIHVPSGNFFGS